MLLTIQDGDYQINPAYVAEVDSTDPDSWEITMVSGTQYTIEGEDLVNLKAALGQAE